MEVANDVAGLIARIRDCGRRASLTLSPETRAAAVEPFLDDVDQVLVMTVRPGFGGQEFMPEALDTVRRVRQQGPPSLDVEVDGGINPHTAPMAVGAGANVLVAGTAIFGAGDRAKAIADLRRAAATA